VAAGRDRVVDDLTSLAARGDESMCGRVLLD
jgi:hypothetical protein